MHSAKLANNDKKVTKQTNTITEGSSEAEEKEKKKL